MAAEQELMWRVYQILGGEVLRYADGLEIYLCTYTGVCMYVH